jgi:hypothetical protein
MHKTFHEENTCMQTFTNGHWTCCDSELCSNWREENRYFHRFCGPIWESQCSKTACLVNKREYRTCFSIRHNFLKVNFAKWPVLVEREQLQCERRAKNIPWQTRKTSELRIHHYCDKTHNPILIIQGENDYFLK